MKILISKEERIKNKFGDEYQFLSYNPETKRVVVIHNPCGSKYEISFKELMSKKSGSRCNYCPREKRFTIESFQKKISDITNGEYSALSDYIGMHSQILMKHNICNNEYLTTPLNFLGTKNRKGRRCPFCAGKRIDTESFKNTIKNLVGNEYTVLGEYIDSDTKILMRHNTCGNEYYVKPNNFVNIGNRCPKCSPIINGKSYKEEELYNFLKLYIPILEKNKRFYVSGKNYYEADIVDEDQKIIIEFDGLYWHAEQISQRGKYNLLEKTKYFNSLGYQVIHIFEDEWDLKKEIVKDKLLNILNLTSVADIKLAIKEISTDICNKFLEKYDIQGKDRSSIKYGLFNKDELLAVMTMSKSKKDFYEISRFAYSRNINNSFEILLNSIIDNHPEITEIVAYADLRWVSTDNNLYSKNNFSLKEVIPPDYFYISPDHTKRYHKFTFRKSVLQEKFPNFYDPKMTEMQIMDKTKYLRIYDCGKICYTKKIK